MVIRDPARYVDGYVNETRCNHSTGTGENEWPLMLRKSSNSFRTEVRAWLEENCPESMRTPLKDDEIVWRGKREKFKNPDSKVWLERMVDKGWTAPEWPAEYGGGGLSKAQARVLQQELRRIKARPALFSFGLWDVRPSPSRVRQ